MMQDPLLIYFNDRFLPSLTGARSGRSVTPSAQMRPLLSCAGARPE